jgi:hypothetical protein
MKHAARSSRILRNCVRHAVLVGAVINLCGWGGPSTYGNPVAAGAAPSQESPWGSMTSFRSKSELFGFFCFESTGKTGVDCGRTMESFKPSGPRFRELVTLYVTTDDAGTVQNLRLVVARSFIDNRSKGVFAGDLVKSFLANAVAGPGDDDIAKLAQEIRVRTMSSGGTVISAQPAPKAPEPPSAAYMTYAGKGEKQTLRNHSGSIQVELANVTEEGTPVLEITESPVE